MPLLSSKFLLDPALYNNIMARTEEASQVVIAEASASEQQSWLTSCDYCMPRKNDPKRKTFGSCQGDNTRTNTFRLVFSDLFAIEYTIWLSS